MADVGTLAPVVIGGALAIAGGVVAAVIQSALRMNEERRRQRAVKFEELVSAVYEHQHWVDRFRNTKLFDEAGEPGVSPMAKIQAITSIYFPQFDKVVQELSRKSDEYEAWVFQAKSKQLRKEPGYADDAGEIYKPYIQKVHELLGQLRAYASREFK
jgi:hypothetical protein